MNALKVNGAKSQKVAAGPRGARGCSKRWQFHLIYSWADNSGTCSGADIPVIEDKQSAVGAR